MKFDRISEKFHNNGALLINNDKGHINQLNRDEIINVFEILTRVLTIIKRHATIIAN